MSEGTKSTALHAQVDAQSGALSLLDSEGHTGWSALRFYMETSAGHLMARDTSNVSQDQGETRWNAAIGTHVQAQFTVAPSPAGQGVIVHVAVTNRSDAPVHFTGYGFEQAADAAGPCISGRGICTFAHSENLRYEQLPLSQPVYPFVRPLPENGRWYGRQGVGPMPALVLGRLDQDRWLVEGAASQKRHMPSWRLELPSKPGRMIDYQSGYFWNGASTEQIAPGETVELESTLYLIVSAAPDQFYDAYIGELVALYGDRFAGPHSSLAHEPVFCSWNYGVYTGINQADCLKRIAIAGETQKGGIFQLDHGYQPRHDPHVSWGYLDAYYPDTTQTWDPQRFPGGPQRFVDECRRHGLKPAIWWTPRIDIGGPISQAHPEWIALNNGGIPIPNVGDLHPDYSVPEVREFIERTLKVVIKQWGFEGIKLDFFSWAFDSPDVVYRNGGTSVQWRRWLIELIRSLLGPEGYFLHCVSCPLGNPFLALDGCDAFRAGSDIDRGDWMHHIDNSSWLLASSLATGRQTWFANVDSFMGSAEFPQNERRFRCAFGYLMGNIVDISGKSELYDPPMLEDYRLLSQRCDQGAGLRVPDLSAFYGRPLPKVLVRLHSPESKTRKEFGVVATVGLFNWEPSSLDLRFDLSDLVSDAASLAACDFWTKEKVLLDGTAVAVRLGARHHLMVDLMARES